MCVVCVCVCMRVCVRAYSPVFFGTGLDLVCVVERPTRPPRLLFVGIRQ